MGYCGAREGEIGRNYAAPQLFVLFQFFVNFTRNLSRKLEQSNWLRGTYLLLYNIKRLTCVHITGSSFSTPELRLVN